MPYSEEVMKFFKDPQNMGEMKDPDAVGEAGNPVCGDLMKIYLKVGENAQGEKFIEDIKFETLGCVAAIATSSVLTTLAKGKTFKEAEQIKFSDVQNALGTLPTAKVHCAQLAVRALKTAMDQARLIIPKTAAAG